jgi:16S rRNA (cytidine1402-2'-O)-methyltransferase
MNQPAHHTRLPPALYVVATPIGNLGDITLRALDVLKGVDRVAAEDTRVSGQLLAHFDIRKPLVSIREHNEREAADKVIAWITTGEAVAYVSDAGTPAISDPGARLVTAVRAAGLDGGADPRSLGSDDGTFRGRTGIRTVAVPRLSAAQDRGPARPAADPGNAPLCALVFYEAPHRIEETLADMAAVLDGSRAVTLARELTKKFESIVTLPLRDAPAWLAADPNHVRGEFVVIVHPPAAAAAVVDSEAMRVLDVLLGALPPTLAAKLASQITGRSKAELYKMTLARKPLDDA